MLLAWILGLVIAFGASSKLAAHHKCRVAQLITKVVEIEPLGLGHGAVDIDVVVEGLPRADCSNRAY